MWLLFFGASIAELPYSAWKSMRLLLHYHSSVSSRDVQGEVYVFPQTKFSGTFDVVLDRMLLSHPVNQDLFEQFLLTALEGSL